MKYLKLLPVIYLSSLLAGCTVSHRISKEADRKVLHSAALQNAHVGISIFDTESNKYLYNFQGDKYFVPASNVKIPTCYAAMKYLGDSLLGLKYIETDSLLYISPTGDPTLLHRDFKTQPVFDFLKKGTKRIAYVNSNWETKLYGPGWSWNDFAETYMVERTELPIYGNYISFNLIKENTKTVLKGDIPFFRYAINERVDSINEKIQITRRRADNIYDVFPANGKFTSKQIPFLTFENERLLEDTLKRAWLNKVYPSQNWSYKKIHSQPTDSVLKPMMHNSDNFFAEQALLMVSNELLGVMNDAKIIDTLLKTDFKDLPQKPRWVDGSGLSRYNLFTPQDFIFILNKIKNEFGIERIKEVLPTGGEGTLSSYYKKDSGFIYAKTGTLSGVVAISGYLITSKNKTFLFSVLVNNHQASATDVRRAVEVFLQNIRKKY